MAMTVEPGRPSAAESEPASAARSAAKPAPLHDERLRVPWTWWPVIVLVVVIGIFEVASGFDYRVYIPVSVFLVGFFVVPLVLTGLVRVRVQDGVLYAGKDSVRVTELTSVQPLDQPATRMRLGPQADPAAHLVVRGWIKGSVLVRLSNPKPVPYWLVSSRNPEHLAAAIKSARAATRRPPS